MMSLASLLVLRVMGSNGSVFEDKKVSTSTEHNAVPEGDNVDYESVPTTTLPHVRRNDTWKITDLPIGRKAIGGKWVYKIKYKSSGDIDRYKARYVAKEFNQKEGINFDETFSLVVKIVTVRCVVNLAVQNNWSVCQLDVNNAFLYGDLDETVYMTLPEGYFNLGDNRVSLLVYVDDIIITGNNSSLIKKRKAFLNTKFMIKDLGRLKYFLDIEVINTENGLCLSQRKYCLDLLTKFSLLACKPSATPLEQNLSMTNEPTVSDPVLDNKVCNWILYEIKWFLSLLEKQKTNTLSKSSAEAEYRAMASVTSKVVWILKILKDLNWEHLLHVNLFCDSQAAIKVCCFAPFSILKRWRAVAAKFR
nr:cysteine-rich RLK (receptor-like protein kinase) 8 [Tanacetum cinerariifolium]